jgi:hypothetical protein
MFISSSVLILNKAFGQPTMLQSAHNEIVPVSCQAYAVQVQAVHAESNAA